MYREMETKKRQDERRGNAIAGLKRFIGKTGPMLAMAQWDTNRDGVITREEFKKGLIKHGMSVIMGDEVDTIFDTVDDNGDGVLEFWELEQYMANSTDWNAKSEDLLGHDIRRQYTQNRAIMAKKKRKEEAANMRLKLAEARAARARVVKEGTTGIAAMGGAAAGAAKDGVSAKNRVHHYLVKMRNKQDEKLMASRARDHAVASQLQSHETFKALSTAARVYAAGRMTTFKCEPGDTLFIVGDPQDTMVFLLEGTTQMIIPGVGKIAENRAGTHFGEGALFGDASVRGATCIATKNAENTKVLAMGLSRKTHLEMAEKFPEYNAYWERNNIKINERMMAANARDQRRRNRSLAAEQQDQTDREQRGSRFLDIGSGGMSARQSTPRESGNPRVMPIPLSSSNKRNPHKTSKRNVSPSELLGTT
jgi:CRP-like cAMP-binding protein